MENDIEEKPMTTKDFQEVVIPAMEGVFSTKKDLEDIRKDMLNFKNEILLGQDKILKDLDILITEKEMGYYQKQKERKLWAIMVEALQKHQILAPEQIKQIKELEIF